MVVDARATDAQQLGGDVDHRKVPMEDWIKSCVYDLVPVAVRTEVGDPNAGGSIDRQITLTGQAEWELAAAGSDLSLTPDHLSERDWTRVKLPNTVQHALFQAGKTSNPWYADNYKGLQLTTPSDSYVRRNSGCRKAGGDGISAFGLMGSTMSVSYGWTGSCSASIRGWPADQPSTYRTPQAGSGTRVARPTGSRE